MFNPVTHVPDKWVVICLDDGCSVVSHWITKWLVTCSTARYFLNRCWINLIGHFRQSEQQLPPFQCKQITVIDWTIDVNKKQEDKACNDSLNAYEFV